MIYVNDNRTYSNLLIFKFENYELDYPQNIKDLVSYSLNKGSFKELECINTLGNSNYKRLYILGLGSTEEFNGTKLFSALGKTIRDIKNTIEDLDILDNLHEDFGCSISQAVEIALYKFNGLKTDKAQIKLKNINIISSYTDSLNKGLIIGNSINLARELINLPSNIVTPKHMEQKAQEIASNENIDIDIIDKYRLEQMGMEGIMSVGKGSHHSPRLILLQYFGNENNKEIIALIGKGVTFDSGGISLKQSKGMEKMVGDMAGAASVLATMKAIAKLKPKKNILALIPVVENMPGSKSYKPGDVITTYSGKTVQIISTDAEGRIILCDAISYAKELGATKIIDVATLTGSCANFLGGINIGLSSNSDELSKALISSGNEVGENIWRLPNNPEYLEQLKTDSADLRNTGTDCGAVVAGLFLQCFAEDTEFAHLDIAGISSYSKAIDAFEQGATAIPTRTLIEYLLN